MASVDLLQDEKLSPFLSKSNESKRRNNETVRQAKINPEDMSQEHVASEKDHISAPEATNIIEKSGIGGENTNFNNDNSSRSTNNPHQNTRRIVATNNSSNRDSGISGSSNESISQIPSPVEEEMDANEDSVTNAAYDSP